MPKSAIFQGLYPECQLFVPFAEESRQRDDELVFHYETCDVFFIPPHSVKLRQPFFHKEEPVDMIVGRLDDLSFPQPYGINAFPDIFG